MTLIHSNLRSCLALLLVALAVTANAAVKLPKLVSDGMVLQRDIPLKIWGWADKGEAIHIKFNHQSFSTKANDKGCWTLTLPATKAGGPYNMIINEIELKNILIGEVWLCSGQSNIEYPMSRLVGRYATEIENSTNTNIRQFKVPTQYNFTQPQDDYASGQWKEANPQNVLDFSAVAYFFAKELNQKYNVPVGIINASLGGSPIESWMSAEALKNYPQYLAEAQKFANQSFVDQLVNSERTAINNWYADLNSADKGLQENWKSESYNDSQWTSISVPGYWAKQGFGMVNGAVWYRRSIEVPASMVGKPVHLQLGRIVDADSVFINGKFVGTTGYQYPQRNYLIPAGILKEGKNSLAVRVISNSGMGGFVEDKPYKLVTETDTICLSGKWLCQLGCTMQPTPGQTFIQWKPTGLFNSMFAPSLPYAIKGVIWYQGESNVDRWKEYKDLLTSMIGDWRAKKAQGDFPVIIAQLPNFLQAQDQPTESGWAAMRNAQMKAALSTVNTSISNNIDLGDWNDIHPQNKLDVGKRIALIAGKLAYNEKGVVNGPVFKSAIVKENKIEILFDNCRSGLVSSDGNSLKHFAIAGADNKYVWANAKIEGNKVIVWSESISEPKSVRYAWADNPQGANLANKDGFPAFPFSTNE
jgi:sialate O-acetylesterase